MRFICHCVACAASFQATAHNAKYCSDLCWESSKPIKGLKLRSIRTWTEGSRSRRRKKVRFMRAFDWAFRQQCLVREHTRRARNRGNGGTHTVWDIARILALQGHKCLYCATALTPNNTHIDHIVPLFRGGYNGADNLCGSCEACNVSKGRKDPIDWLMRAHRVACGIN